MKMIPAEKVRNFISAIENIFYTLHLDNETWNAFDTITDMHLGCHIRDTSQDEMIEKIAIVWHIEDVQCIRPDLTNGQASEVLQHLKKNHDATVGINWDSIETVADILFPADLSEMACQEDSI